MTKSDPWHNEYECPNCDEWIAVPIPLAAYVNCPECKAKLEIHPNADWFDGFWHDRTTLSIVDPEREHMKLMLEHAKKHEHQT